MAWLGMSASPEVANDRHRGYPDAAHSPAVSCPGTAALAGSQRRLHVEHELNVVADHDAAGGQHRVGGDAVVRAIELTCRGESGPGAAIRVRSEAVDFDPELNQPGDALDGQVAGHDQVVAAAVHAGGLEGHRRMAGDVEKALTLDIVITRFIARVERRAVNRHHGRRLQRASRRDDLALELGEVAADLADHQMTGDEPDMRVHWVDVPGAGDVAGDIDRLFRHDCLLPRGNDADPGARSPKRNLSRLVLNRGTRERRTLPAWT